MPLSVSLIAEKVPKLICQCVFSDQVKIYILARVKLVLWTNSL